MQSIGWTSWSALVLTACASVGSTEAAIVAGDEGGDPAAVLVFVLNYGSCTGAVISPWHVLVARSCVQPEGVAAPLSIEHMAVARRWPASVEHWAGVASVHVPRNAPEAAGGGLAILTLDTELPIEPFELRRVASPDLVGRPVQASGFGETANPDDLPLRRRTTTATIASLSPELVMTVVGTFCRGDGLLYMDDRTLVGLAVSATAPCTEETVAWIDAADDDLAWIDEVIEATTPAASEWTAPDDAAVIADAAAADAGVAPDRAIADLPVGSPRTVYGCGCRAAPSDARSSAVLGGIAIVFGIARLRRRSSARAARLIARDSLTRRAPRAPLGSR